MDSHGLFAPSPKIKRATPVLKGCKLSRRDMFANGVANQFSGIGTTQFLHDPGTVGFHGLGCNAQLPRNFLVAKSIRHEAKQVLFALG